MSKNQEIVNLFSKDFTTTDFRKRGRADKFVCPLESVCKVSQEKEPIWTAGFGDEETNVMIVAEAPSSKGGLGPNITGQVKEWVNEESVNALFRFVKSYFNTVPYFTDLMKCGVAKQTKQEKQIFKTRISQCLKHYLVEKIKIIKPEFVLCVGIESFNALTEAKRNKLIAEDVELIKLIHYGKQANLPLTSSDKENIIWPYQLKKISKDKLLDLDFFNNNATSS